jgi:hypothetical protein
MNWTPVDALGRQVPRCDHPGLCGGDDRVADVVDQRCLVPHRVADSPVLSQITEDQLIGGSAVPRREHRYRLGVQGRAVEAHQLGL